MSTDEKYMQRCLELARLASGNTAPNPMVGSVLVHRDRIIGEGYHQLYGQAHAEANAIESVENKTLLKEATLYVNLEPCAHHGNTPPCADLIVRAGIPRVVIGAGDSSARVSGKGIRILEEGGCEVKRGVLEDSCRYLNRRFFTFHEKQRPYVVLKWAQTLDGYIDKDRRKDDPIQPNWITNEVSRHLVHKWRSQEQSILIGSHTALKDNPGLNVRESHGLDPLRIVIDRDLEIDESFKLIHDPLPLVLFTDINSDPRRARELAEYNVEVIRLNFKDNLMRQIFEFLYSRKILSVFVEGGGYTLSQFIASNMWDEARVFIGNRFFHSGVKAPQLPAREASEYMELNDTRLYIFRNQ